MRRAAGYGGGYGYFHNGDYLYDEAVGPLEPHFIVHCDVWAEHPAIQNILDCAEAAQRLSYAAEQFGISESSLSIETDPEDEIIVVTLTEPIHQPLRVV
jgi:hypothetical protein